MPLESFVPLLVFQRPVAFSPVPSAFEPVTLQELTFVALQVTVVVSYLRTSEGCTEREREGCGVW